MRPASLAAPTKRELLLVFILLVVLLCITENNLLSSSYAPRIGNDGGGPSDRVVVSTEVLYPEPRMKWTDSVPETTIVFHVPGWTMFDNLYALNGTFFVVTSNPESIPDRSLIMSSGIELENGPDEPAKRLPTDKDIRIISPEEARTFFGTSATRIDGANWIVNEPKQFITHYYHFTAEMLFGLWRAYSSLDPHIARDGRTALPPPRRLLFTHAACDGWRDYAAMNQWVLRGAFPSLTLEYSSDWADRAAQATPFTLERALLFDRAASHRGPNFATTWRPASEPFALRGSPHWWAPVRINVLEFSGLAAEWVHGPDPGMLADRSKLVITYISRQGWGRRMLREADHLRLVAELEKLRQTYGYEVNVVSMDKVPRAQQFELAGRTTIMMGLHGNGLTSLVWMRPSLRATVIEFFFPKGIAFDYEWTTRALGMTHYGVWNNVTFTRPNVPGAPNYPEGFQGNDIPLDGAVVADLVRRRLELELDID